MNSLKFTSTLLSIFIGYVSFSQAASIQNVKGNKALLVLDGDELNVGDEVFSIDENGKKKHCFNLSNDYIN